MTTAKIVTILSSFFWGIAVVLSIIGAIIFFSRGRSKEKFKEKIIFYGFGINILGNGLTRLFVFLALLQLEGIFVNMTYLGEITFITEGYKILSQIASSLSAIATIMIALIYEYYAGHKKYLITILYSVLGAVVIFGPFDLSSLVALILTFPLYAIVYSKMLYIFTKWTEVKYKTFSAFFFCGFTTVGLGAFLAHLDILALELFPLELSPLLIISSSLFLIIPLYINPSKLSRPLMFWYAAGIFIIGIIAIFLFLMVTTNMIILWLFIGVLVITIFSLLLRYVRRDILNMQDLEEKTQNMNVMEMFSRPQRISDEEITISREKRICLVCKNQLSRSMYICPDCNTYYCNRCTETLAKLENQCWVCNTPFDESRPTKPTLDEGLEPEIEFEHGGKDKKGIKSLEHKK